MTLINAGLKALHNDPQARESDPQVISPTHVPITLPSSHAFLKANQQLIGQVVVFLLGGIASCTGTLLGGDSGLEGDSSFSQGVGEHAICYPVPMPAKPGSHAHVYPN